MASKKKAGLPGYLHVDHIGLTVPDLDAASAFYGEVFGAEELYRLGPFDSAEMPKMPDGMDWTGAHVNVKDAKVTLAMLSVSSNVMLELFQYDAPEGNKTPPRNNDVGGHHVCFKVEDIQAASDYLAGKGCTVMPGKIELNEGPCGPHFQAQYVLDPWGNQLELVQYDRQNFMDNTDYKPYQPNK